MAAELDAHVVESLRLYKLLRCYSTVLSASRSIGEMRWKRSSTLRTPRSGGCDLPNQMMPVGAPPDLALRRRRTHTDQQCPPHPNLVHVAATVGIVRSQVAHFAPVTKGTPGLWTEDAAMTRLVIVLLFLGSLACPAAAQGSAEQVASCGAPAAISDGWTLATPAEVKLDREMLCGIGCEHELS